MKNNTVDVILQDLTLTKEQKQGIKERLKLPDKTVRYSHLKRNMISYRCSKTYDILN